MAHHRLVLSISTFSLYPLSLQRALPLIAEAGFDGIELVAPARITPRWVDATASLAQACGLEVLSVHQTLFGFGPAMPLKRRMTDAIRLALDLNCPRVVVHSPHVHQWDEPEGVVWLETLERLKTSTRERSLLISVENVDRNPLRQAPVVLNTIPALSAFAASHQLGVTLDTCHAMRNGTDLLAALEHLFPWLVNIHLSDWRDIGWGERSLFARTLLANHRMPGQGQAPLKAFIARLAQKGYVGPVTLEVNPWAVQGFGQRKGLERLRQAIAFIRQAEEEGLAEGEKLADQAHLVYP